MAKWIRKLFRKAKRLPGFLGDLAAIIERAFQAILDLWNASNRENRRRVKILLSGVDATVTSIRALSRATSRKFKDLKAYTRSYTKNRVDRAVRDLTGLVTSVRSNLTGLVNANREHSDSQNRARVRDIADLRDWTTQRVASVSNRLRDLTRNLTHVLGGPRVLAHWLVDAMLAETLAWMRRNQLKLAGWLLTALVPATVAFALRIERVLGRLL